ncbi:unnamed protein product [Closterium sp. Naga37s-1]|nr:unnamed protein product [Closterium sp. Naga37s-1]
MRRRLKCAHGGPNPSSLYNIPHVAGEALREETPSASQESGQQRGAARRSPGLDEGCGTEPAPPARADIRATSARAEEPPGQGPRRREGRWSPQCVRESALHSPAPDAQPPQTHSWPDLEQDPARDRFRHAHRHSAGPVGLRNQPNAGAEGTARDDPNPSDAQVTPSPASPEIAAESVARGIALGVSAGLPDHEEMGGEVNEDVQGTADRPLCADESRDAQEKVGEERAAAEADAEASARAPAVAVRPGGSTQHVQGPTNTPARWGAQQADGEELAPARSGGRARLQRGAQGHAGEARQAQAPAARSPRNPRAPDPVLRMDPSPPTAPQPMPARRPIEDAANEAPQTGHAGAAGGRGTRGIRVGRGGNRRGRRGNGRGRRGGGARGSNRCRTGASGYARTAERLVREGAEGGEEVPSEEAEDDVENEESEGGDPAFNLEREGMLEAEAEEDEEELELLREAEFPNQQARGEPANRTSVLEALAARHPSASQLLPDWLHTATAEDPPTIEARDFRRLLAKLPNGVGAGPSGTTFEHIRDAALGNAEVLTHLLALSNTALAGKLPTVAGDLLTASRLLAFTKPQGGTRPIAVGECLLRIIAKAALFLTAPAARTHFAPLQFGVAVAGGIEAAIHTARTPVGTPRGCAGAVRERLAVAASPLPLLAQMDPQLSLLLLTRCVSRRASFLARTTPLEALPEAEWSAWGEQLLHTFLDSAHIMRPRSARERRRIWRQAALPVTLGGLGITDPAVEGSYAYLASVISAAHLLHSLEDSLHPAVAALLPLLDPTHGSPHALPARLAAAEAALPPEALEATAGETGPADAGGHGNGPRDEESRAVDASRDVANAEAIEDGTIGVRANGDENDGERAIGGGVTGDHANNSVTPRDEANAAIAGQREDLPCGSPAYCRESLTNVGEGNAPGAPHPLRRSARRTPREQAPAEAGTGPRARPERAADLRNGGGSDPQTLTARQARSRQGAQEEAGEEQDRSPRFAPRQEPQGNSSVRREEGARTLGDRQVGGRTAGRGRGAAGRRGRARGGGPENVYQQAGRRALNEMSGDDETTTSDSSFVAAESTDSTSSSESLDDEQFQTPA